MVVVLEQEKYAAGPLRRVLIVDGEGEVRRVLARHLSRLGYWCDGVEDVAGAVVLCRGAAFDVIVCETHLCDEVCVSLLRAERVAHGTLGLVFGAMAFEADVAAGIAAGVDAYLVDAATVEAVAGAIRLMLGDSGVPGLGDV